jgi:hypothetical protein
MAYEWYDFVGNIGVFLILLSYLLLQLNKMRSDSIIYSALNGLGALFILVSLYFRFNLSAFIIESFWFVFSLIGIIKVFTRKENYE